MSYDAATIRQLNALTTDFYAREAASFSATRQSPWLGWETAWNAAAAVDPTLAARPIAVLDLGCGNLRFERFLAAQTGAPLTVRAYDSCPALAEAGAEGVEGEPPRPLALALHFHKLDLVESLLDGTLADQLPEGACDIAVAFGLMHHLPTFALRARVLEGLLGSLRPGGFAVVSFWQFLNDPRVAAKAAAVTAEGRATHCLPTFQENDFLLGWQHAEGVYRFCHHTPEDEIDALLAAIREPSAPSASSRTSAAPLPFREVTRFSADGKQGNLNRYVVLQRSQC